MTRSSVLLALALAACSPASPGGDGEGDDDNNNSNSGGGDAFPGDEIVPVAGAAQLRISDREACVLLVGGQLKCWGKIPGLRSFTPPRAVRRIEHKSGEGVLLVFQDGTIGKLYSFDGGRVYAINGVTGVRSAAYGNQYLVTLDGDGKASSWKATQGMDEPTVAPFGDLSALPAMRQVELDQDGTTGIGVTREGRVWTWGVNAGTGQQAVPAEVPGVSGATQATLDSQRFYALLADGTVTYWPTAGNAGGPQTLAGLDGGVAEVRAYNVCGCARMKDATLRCWGIDLCWGVGGYGAGSGNPTLEPHAVAGMTDVAGVDVRGANASVCARKKDGTAWCWGLDSDRIAHGGQLSGDGKPAKVEL